MRNEPENRVEDRRVTDAYRALANESAPGHLNREILTMAARAATPYARARAWMRPAAWAATIALCFAFVLELTQLPSTDTGAVSISPTADSDDSERRNVPDEETLTKTRIFAPVQPSPVALEEADAALETERKRAATPPARRDVHSKEAFTPRDMTVMQNAEELARAQAGSDRGVAATGAQASGEFTERPAAEAMSAELAAARRQEADRLAADRVTAEARSAAASLAAVSDTAGSEQACPTAARETPEAWLACIRELRESGKDERADGEYEEFRQLFPEFDDSDTYK